MFRVKRLRGKPLKKLRITNYEVGIGKTNIFVLPTPVCFV